MMSLHYLVKFYSRQFSCKRRLLESIVCIVFVLIFVQTIHIFLLYRLEDIVDKQLKRVRLKSLPGSREFYDKMKHSFEIDDISDSSGEYKLLRNLIKFPSTTVDHNRVTLISQCSYHQLHHLVNLVNIWTGEMSISIYVLGNELQELFVYFVTLRHCHPKAVSRSSFHLVLPLTRTYGKTFKSYQDIDDTLITCASLNNGTFKFSLVRNYDLSKTNSYPGNLLRNVALKSARTDYILVLDIDILPSRNLENEFADFATRIRSTANNGTIFVLPAFEIEDRFASNVPTDKTSLLKLWNDGVARPFYSELCEKCHRVTDFEAWKRLPASSQLAVSYEVEWKDPYEPFYIGPASLPLYDVKFRQYGFNRISQVCETHVAGYRFAVLNNAFVVHKGFKRRLDFHASKEAEQRRNVVLYRQFKELLKMKYPSSAKRC